jgi:fatty-acyl-CoA synthase
MSAQLLYRRMERTAGANPHRPAVTFVDASLDPRTYTAHELHARAEGVASRLARLPLDDSAPLGLLLASHEDQIVHYLAALQLGLVPAILTPPNRKLNAEYYARTTEAVLDRCRFSAIVTDVELALTAPTFTPFTIRATNRPAAKLHRADYAPPLDASFLQFSSGTTGIKRGVLVKDHAVLAQIDTYGRSLRASESDVVVSWLPLYHDMGFIACLNMPLVLGIHTVMIDPLDWVASPALFLHVASRYRATLAWNPNFAYAFMGQRVPESELADLELSSLRALVNCSEPVTFSSQRRFADRFSGAGFRADAFRGCYAMAETTFALTDGVASEAHFLDYEGPNGTAARPEEPRVSVGRPLPAVELLVVDPETGEPQDERAIGELWVRSPFTFEGYYNDPEATDDAFAPGGWYRTGDLGYRADQAFHVVGRKKDVIIVGGVNVFPNDVEELVSGIPGVVPGRVSVFSEFDRSAETERITVLFETSAGADTVKRTTTDVRQRILAGFQISNFRVHAVEPGWLVKSSSGKIARSENRRKWSERAASPLAG